MLTHNSLFISFFVETLQMINEHRSLILLSIKALTIVCFLFVQNIQIAAEGDT